jgi:1,3-beta-glucan synthase
MAARPGYGQPDPRNPFANPPQQYGQPPQYPQHPQQGYPQQTPYQSQEHLQQYPQSRQDYEYEPDDPYGSRNASTVQLTGGYDQPGGYDPYGT